MPDFELNPLEKDCLDYINMGRVADVAACFDQGVSLRTIVGYSGESWLHAAAARGQSGVIELLLDRGMSLSAQDEQGMSPLMSAVEHQKMDAAETLLMHGADPNQRANNGSAPLFRAAHFGNVELIELLLRHGADPNIAFESGLTPLFQAINRDHLNAAKALVAGGAKVEATNNGGITAVEFAGRLSGNPRGTLIAEFLLSVKTQNEAKGGTENAVTVMKPLQFKTPSQG